MKLTRRQTLPAITALGVSTLGGLNGLSPLSPLIGSTPAHAMDLSTLMNEGPLGEHVKGDLNAPVTLIKYASMTCPHCRAWHKDVYPTIKEKYIDKGVVKFYFREFPFDPSAAAAFMLAECAGEDKYFSMVDILYDKQASWSRGKVVDELYKISKLAGFTQESFNACLKDQKLLDNVLSIQKKAAEDYGVNSTPTFFINGKKYPNMSADAMGEIIESLA